MDDKSRIHDYLQRVATLAGKDDTCEGTYLFEVKGTGRWVMVIANCQGTLYDEHSSPVSGGFTSSLIYKSSDLFFDLLNGQTSPQTAVFTGQLKVTGSVAKVKSLEGNFARAALPDPQEPLPSRHLFKEGYVYKRRAFFSGWLKRYVVVIGGGEEGSAGRLEYFREGSDVIPRAIFSLKGASVGGVQEVFDTNLNRVLYTFFVAEGGYGKEVFFGCRSCMEAVEWMQVIRTAIGDVHPEFNITNECSWRMSDETESPSEALATDPLVSSALPNNVASLLPENEELQRAITSNPNARPHVKKRSTIAPPTRSAVRNAAQNVAASKSIVSDLTQERLRMFESKLSYLRSRIEELECTRDEIRAYSLHLRGTLLTLIVLLLTWGTYLTVTHYVAIGISHLLRTFIQGRGFKTVNGHNEEGQMQDPDRSPSLSSDYPYLLCWCAFFAVVYQLRIWSWVYRKVYINSLTLVVLFGLRAARETAKTEILERDKEKFWRDVHGGYALYMFECIVRAKGLWVKTGQYLGSRADVFPEEYCRYFGRLQDAIPPVPFKQVTDTLIRELAHKTLTPRGVGLGLASKAPDHESHVPKELTHIFKCIDPVPLGSASVAQVHRGTLVNGTDVAIKVMHEGVDQLLSGDLDSMMSILSWVAYIEPDFDFRDLLGEWVLEIRKELDFRNEVMNLKEVYGVMKMSGLDCVIPTVYESVSTKYVCIMGFCEGFKVTDTARISELGVDCDAAVSLICECFGYQMYVAGVFNGDPHPGNILLQCDPTMTPALESSTSPKTHARPVLLDWGLTKRFTDKVRIAFCKQMWGAHTLDAALTLEGYEDLGLVFQRLDPGEDLENTRFLMRDTAPYDESIQQTIEHNEKFWEKRKTQKLNMGKTNPVKKYAGDLFLFLRVTELLHGLASQLRSRVTYMKIMAKYARMALEQRTPKSNCYNSDPPPPMVGVRASMDEWLVYTIQKFVHSNKVLGCQVCVFQDGMCFANVSGGRMGTVDLRAMATDTLVCGFSVTKALMTTALHACISKGLVELDAKVKDIWPEFAAQGKEEITVRHILTHSSGLQHFLPKDSNFDTLVDMQGCIKELEQESPVFVDDGKPGKHTSYHVYSYGWLIAAIIEKVTKQSVQQAIYELVLLPAGIVDDVRLGVLQSHDAYRVCRIESEMMESLAEDPAGVKSMMEKGAMSQFQELANSLEETNPTEATSLRKLLANMEGKEAVLLDPRMYNYRTLRNGFVPSVNGYFTAKGLAKMYDAILSERAGIIGPSLLREVSTCSGTDAGVGMILDGRSASKFGLGYQLFTCTDDPSSSKAPNMFGHTGVCGSVGICHPESGLSVGIMLNRAQEDREPVMELLRIILQARGVGSHVVDLW